MKGYIQIIDGPNLNLTGKRQPDLFGEVPMDELLADLTKRYEGLVHIEYTQSNIEGELINELHRCGYDEECLGIILNGGGYTQTSLALADAVVAIPVSVIEVHMTNLHRRGRPKSHLTPVCKGSISGFGLDSYKLAVEAIMLEQAMI